MLWATLWALVAGFGISGAVQAFVPRESMQAKLPTSAWNTLFIHGHGLWTNVENAIVGPLIALVSCVCSVGNVALAAALWKGGISFGGVVSFLFADLIALPVLMVYRRQYGARLAARLLGVFWCVMAAAGLITGAIFGAAGLVPPARPTHIVPESLAWNSTSILDICALAFFALGYRAHRSRRALGPGSRYALDPVCGMQVQTASAPATTRQGSQSYWFCSDHCRERFEAQFAVGSSG